MTERRERELVLAPNEFAYILDTTKGLIACYVGPNKTSLAQTDQPVRLNPVSGRFESVELSQAVTLFVTAPANAYVVLQNPAADNAHPRVGVANGLIDLQTGRCINVPGPTSFALWPGQVAEVIEGHRLRSDEYLVVRIQDAGAANHSWRAALGLPPAGEEESGPEPERFGVGDTHVIRGSDVRFYIPPTGVEVVPDRAGQHVREAVVLQELEYCVLIGEQGTREVVRGERVVFPRADQRFEERGGERVFRALQLSDTSGVHLRVVADHVDEAGTARVVGEERFVTGAGVIWFPRPEVEVLPDPDGNPLHTAVVVAKGEGRYVLRRETGEVRLVPGPCTLLPDPRHETLIQRALSDRASQLLFPDNEEAALHNESLREGLEGSRDPRYQGAVRVEVWSSYAVQVVNRGGERRVVQGPQSVLLEYDEMLQPLRLSTGRPKTNDNPLETAFLQVHGNKVSDSVSIVTRDMVRATLSVAYRVRFEGADPDRWFAVSDYIKLLCDSASSRIKARCRTLGVRELQAGVAPVVRGVLLGERTEGERPGLAFAENAMRVYDVEILDFQVSDPAIAALLDDAQQRSMGEALAVSEREQAVDRAVRAEALERQLATERDETARLRATLAEQEAARAHAASEGARQRALALHALEAQLAQLRSEAQDVQEAARLARERAAAEQCLALTERDNALRQSMLQAQVQAAVQASRAFSPELVQAVNRLGDQALLERVADNFGELAAVEGRGLLETARRYLDFVPTTLLPSIQAPGSSQQSSEA